MLKRREEKEDKQKDVPKEKLVQQPSNKRITMIPDLLNKPKDEKQNEALMINNGGGRTPNH
jgi:hypothetical protein